MGFLTIASIDVPVTSFRESPERVGDEGRTYAGAYWTQLRTTKRRYAATTGFLTATEYATLLAATDDDAAVTVVVTMPSVTTTLTARVRCEGEISAQTSLWTVALDIREV